jgi:2-polyprenyl-3-methyl-5-hydroxy-6-metoxy-1,4-benzoquinol methylase
MRERDYYNVYAKVRGEADVNFDPISGDKRRPWNPYWRVFELVKQQYVSGARLLDLGCGWGSNTIVFAKIGYDVDAIDISEENIASTRRLAERYQLAERVRARIETAETLGYPNGRFDVVVGIDILHHVQIAEALAEVRRVLKPCGVAIFREPLENRAFDGLRNTALFKRLRSNAASLSRHITADERKLNTRDLALMDELFPGTRIESFRMLSRLDVIATRMSHPLERLDYILKALPGFEWWRGTGVFIMTKLC